MKTLLGPRLSSASILALLIAVVLFSTPAAAQNDYSQSIGADFVAQPTDVNPFGPNAEWELHGRSGTTADLASVGGGLPASGQAGWCQSDDGVSCTDPTGQTQYFSAQWQSGVTIIPGVGGHGAQEVVWTAPANVNGGAVSLSGSLEQLFETERELELKVTKGGSTVLSVLSLIPTVPGAVLQRVDFGPVSVGVNPGDSLTISVDASGNAPNPAATFGTWDLTITEIPEPTSITILLASASLLLVQRRRQS